MLPELMMRSRIARLVARYGRDTVSAQSLEPGLTYWFHGSDTCVVYYDTGSAWVAVGGPIGRASVRESGMRAFSDAASRAKRRVRFFATEEVGDENQWTSMAIGLQPEWEPAQWVSLLASKASLRKQLRRARAKWVRIREVGGADLSEPGSDLHGGVCRVVRNWQMNQSMAPMAFLVSMDLFGNFDDKRYFVAEVVAPGRAVQVVGILVMMEIPARQGWFFRDVLRAQEAPNGTVELLFDHVMRVANAEEVVVITFGLVPLAGEVSTWLARVRYFCHWLYDFEGLRVFKSKLLPTAWRPVFLTFPKTERGISATVDSLSAFAAGSWFGFAMRTVVHAQPILLWCLALFLIPWIALLGAIPGDVWFPGTAVKIGWIGFDVILLAALIHVAIAWCPRKAFLLGLLATADAALGGCQLVLFNRHVLDTSPQWFAAVFAVLAPCIAAVVLFLGAFYRDRLYQVIPIATPPEATVKNGGLEGG